MKVKSEGEVAQSCLTHSDPMDSVHGILQATVLEWDAIAFSYIVTKVLIDVNEKFTNAF